MLNIKHIDWPKLTLFVLVSELLGGIGSFATFTQINTWYAQLAKPPFNPPNWLFGPVWAVLFALMGLSAYIIWTSSAGHKLESQAKNIFIAQFVLNILWSFIFFTMHQPLVACIEICLLWLTIVSTILHFGKISKLAAGLLVPYLLWVTFAAVLNFAIWLMN